MRRYCEQDRDTFGVVKLKYMDGRQAYRYIGYEGAMVIRVPKEGHDAEFDEWREFARASKSDYLGYPIYVQIP